MPRYSFDLFNSNPQMSPPATPLAEQWTRQPSRMFAARALAREQAMGPVSRNPSPTEGNTDPGDQMDRLAKAMDYAAYMHDLFGGLAEMGGGDSGKRAFEPTSQLLDGIGAGATFAASRQRRSTYRPREWRYPGSPARPGN